MCATRKEKRKLGTSAMTALMSLSACQRKKARAADAARPIGERCRRCRRVEAGAARGLGEHCDASRDGRWSAHVFWGCVACLPAGRSCSASNVTAKKSSSFWAGGGSAGIGHGVCRAEISYEIGIFITVSVDFINYSCCEQTNKFLVRKNSCLFHPEPRTMCSSVNKRVVRAGAA